MRTMTRTMTRKTLGVTPTSELAARLADIGFRCEETGMSVELVADAGETCLVLSFAPGSGVWPSRRSVRDGRYAGRAGALIDEVWFATSHGSHGSAEYCRFVDRVALAIAAANR